MWFSLPLSLFWLPSSLSLSRSISVLLSFSLSPSLCLCLCLMLACLLVFFSLSLSHYPFHIALIFTHLLELPLSLPFSSLCWCSSLALPLLCLLLSSLSFTIWICSQGPGEGQTEVTEHRQLLSGSHTSPIASAFSDGLAPYMMMMMMMMMMLMMLMMMMMMLMMMILICWDGMARPPHLVRATFFGVVGLLKCWVAEEGTERASWMYMWMVINCTTRDPLIPNPKWVTVKSLRQVSKVALQMTTTIIMVTIGATAMPIALWMVSKGLAGLFLVWWLAYFEHVKSHHNTTKHISSRGPSERGHCKWTLWKVTMYRGQVEGTRRRTRKSILLGNAGIEQCIGILITLAVKTWVRDIGLPAGHAILQHSRSIIDCAPSLSLGSLSAYLRFSLSLSLYLSASPCFPLFSLSGISSSKVPLPDVQGRLKILQTHAKKVLLQASASRLHYCGEEDQEGRSLKSRQRRLKQHNNKRVRKHDISKR